MKGVHVVVESLLQAAVVVAEGAEGLPVHHQVEGYQQEQDQDGRDAVAPDVYAFVVHHEQAPQDLSWRVEVYPVPVGYVSVVFHEFRRSLVVSDVMPFIPSFPPFHPPLSLLPYFFLSLLL